MENNNFQYSDDSDDDASMEGIFMPFSTGNEDENGNETEDNDDQDSSDTEEDVMRAESPDNESMVDIIDYQADDDWGFGNFMDELDEPEDQGPASDAVLNFRAYVAKMRDHEVEFTRYEESSVELMHLLMRKGASLDTYNEVMRWHLRQSENDNPAAFISRERLIKRLRARYNVAKDFLKEEKIIVPSTGSKLNITYSDARDCVVSLLTDPRFHDNDFLHFGDDPLAPPPPGLDYVEDINTGLSYTETYKKLITKPGKQMLVPIILYIDGAVTGQFDKLQVEALKMTLGIFNRRARDREYAWRTLGKFYQIPNRF